MHEQYIDANQKAWSLLARDHYLHYRKRLAEPDYALNPLARQDLGEVAGKSILHLQCNTGADSILLTRLGATVTGVDLVPENIHYARLLAEEYAPEKASFIVSDILRLKENLSGRFDLVLTTDGVIGWIPDLPAWADVIAHFLKEDGCFFLHDAHPFYLVFDEEALGEGRLIPRYSYFAGDPDVDPFIGGYAGEAARADNYYWNHTLGSIINALAAQNLYVTSLREYDRCVQGMGGKETDPQGLSYHAWLEGRLPITYSLRAEYRHR